MLAKFTESPRLIACTAAYKHDIPKSNVQRATEHELHSYKCQLHPELYEDDFDGRIKLYVHMLQKIEENADIISKICFGDKTLFTLNGTVNRHHY